MELNVSESEECFFCGSRHFYFESPLELGFLGRASICYVCEARYKGIEIDNPEDKYNQRDALSARMSESALHWKERIEQHSQHAAS